MKKRSIALTMAACIVGLAVAGCGSSASSSSATDSSTEASVAEEAAESTDDSDAVTLVWWKFNDEADLDLQVERWNDEHPDEKIKLDIQKYSLDDLVSKLQLAFSTGQNVPDIADVEISSVGLFMQGTEDDIQFLPLDEYIEPLEDQLQMQRLKQYNYAGHYYGVDINCGTCVAYYNVELLEAAGIDYTTINTWDDYEEVGRKYLEATGKPFVAWETTSNNELYALIAERGGDYFDENANLTLNSEANVKTLTWMQDMVKEGIAVPADGGAVTSEEFIASFIGGDVASVIMPSWYTLQMYYTMPDLSGKMAMKVMPSYSETDYTSVGIGGTSMMVYKNGEHADLCARFLVDARLSYDGAYQVGAVMGMDPVNLTTYDALAQDDSIFTKTFLVDDFFETMADAQKNVAKQNYNSYYPYLEDELTENVLSALFVDMADVQETLDNSQAKLQQTLNDL